MILFAVGALLVWLGLAFGIWVTILAAFPLILALIVEWAIRRGKA